MCKLFLLFLLFTFVKTNKRNGFGFAKVTLCISTQNFFVNLMLQRLVSYKHVSYKKHTCNYIVRPFFKNYTRSLLGNLYEQLFKDKSKSSHQSKSNIT